MSNSTAANETQNEDAVTETKDEVVAEQATTEEAATQDAESEAVVAETAADELVAEATAAEEAVSDETVSEETVAEEAAAEEAAADEAVAEQAAEEVVAEQAAEEVVAEQAAEEVVAEQAAAAPVSEEPAVEEAVEATMAEEAPAEEAAAKAAEEAPAEAAAEEAPAEAAAEEAPLETAASSEETPAEAAPTEAEKKPAPPMDPEHAAEIGRLKAAMESQEDIEGKIIGWNKGGYHVALGRVAAFCPVSMIEIGSPRSPKRYLDKTFPFRIIEVQDDGKRIVVSRAAAIKAEREAEAKRVKEMLAPGQVMKGRVSSLTEFGAFVDLGGRIEGLVHISELSRRRVDKPDEIVQKGQEVEVQVLKIEKGGKRISLSMKRLEDDPWEGVAERWPKGAQFKGQIVRKAEFGVFVEVEPGLEGLVHVSRLPLGKNLESDDIVEGQEVEGWVHEVERKRRRLSLSLRPVAEGNPWDGVHERYPEGELVQGTVERVADFGAFVELEPGLTGLLPFSMLGAVGNPKRQFHPGKEVSVKVLSIDKSRKRISLGTEQSKAEGSTQDYKEYKKQQSTGGGMNAMAAALAKIKDQIPTA